MSTLPPQGPTLSEAQWTQVHALADTLDAGQLAWLSGFFAGVAHGRRPVALQPGTSSPQPAIATTAAGARRLTVLYGTETGNSAAVARQLAERLAAAGHAASLLDLADCKPRQVGELQDLLIVTSTYGEGDPPQPTVSFFEFVEGRKAPRLDGVRYAVLALGDSTYERFCAAGRRLDERLAALGAERLLPRVDCDVDYEDAAGAWIEATLQALGRAATEGAVGPAITAVTVAAARDGTAAPAFDRKNPFRARVIDNLVLTGRGSSKEVRHVELSLEGSGLRHEPGDALGLLPCNAPDAVDPLLDLTGLSADAPVTVQGQSLTLRAALVSALDVVNLTPRFLDQWARLSGASTLRELATPERAAERTAFARSHHVIDVMRDFPVTGLDAATLVAALRPLQPRLYSIASSAAATPGEIHLTVATVRYPLHGQPRTGVASRHLATHGAPDAQLPVYVQSQPHFRLPAGDVPIVMIGAGTGVAPFRAFLQDREARDDSGRAWLFFGDRRFRTDFLYQTEWQGWLADGRLSRMDVAFSRDAAQKTYVWHRLLEHGQDLYGWLEDGAHLYVCGDAERMAPDVHRALGEVVMRHRGCDADGAHDYLRGLQETHRYQRDVY